ncbi:MAG: hypothetical protein CMJ51_04145, partial [Planctomycetaceae bacterium]|nr:hypothetical protein [Planctomycetaceae bacterium]
MPSATQSDRAATLLSEVRRRGIRIWNVGSEIHHAGPEGVLGVDLRDCLVDAKADLLDLLLAEHATEERGHPLTRTQQRFQVIRGGGTNPGDHIRLIHRLRGPVDFAALESAFLELVIQQPSLRTSFIAHEGDLVQRVVAPWRFRIRRRSMIDATSDEVNAESQRFIGESFDLASGNLLRAIAIELGDDSHLLVIIGHHLVVDGWSTSVLLEELGRLYAIAADGRFREREPENARFGDHARAMLDWEGSERCREEIGRWQAEIAPGTTASALPTDEDRDRDRLVEFDAVRGVLEGLLVSRLGERARKWRTGSMQILQAVLSCLVARAAGQDLAITGLALTNRTRTEHERMIGNFANESIVRVEVDPGDDFTSVLARVDEAVRRSTERIDTAFEQVVEAVGLQRIGRRRLAVPIFFSFQDRRRGGSLAFTDVSVELVPDHHLNTFQEIGLRVIEEADSMQIRIEYDRTLYTPQRIESFLANLVAMLECVLEDPRTSLADLPFDASLAEGITVVSGTPRSGSQEHVEPASMIETRLAELWTDLLGVHPVGRFDDFFDLGGSSLLAVRLIDRVHEIFGTSLGLEALVSSPTLHELAGRIER